GHRAGAVSGPRSPTALSQIRESMRLNFGRPRVEEVAKFYDFCTRGSEGVPRPWHLFRHHKPPAGSMKLPVTKHAFSLASDRMASATSLGYPPRCKGILGFNRSTRPGSPPDACISV